MLFYLTPVWATLFAYVALSDRVGLGRWLAIAGGLLGCLLVMRVNPLSFDYDKARSSGAGGGYGLGLGLGGDPALSKCRFSAYHVYAIFCWLARRPL